MASQTNVIDLSNPDIHQSAALLKQACKESDFFYIINHGINEELTADFFAQAKKYFTSPVEEKMKLMVGQSRGYKPIHLYDEEIKEQSKGEAFILFQETPSNGKNILPGETVWPPADAFPGWKETMVKYREEALNAVRAVFRIVAVALGLSVDFFDQPKLVGNALTCLTTNHYPVEDLDPSKGYLLGTPAHQDPTLITMLHTDEVAGLQICTDANAKPRIWEDALPRKGAIIVIIGDTLERISNGIFRSTMHRVQYCQERYVIGFFVYQSPEGTIECAPTCTSEENPPKYPPIECKEHYHKLFQLA